MPPQPQPRSVPQKQSAAGMPSHRGAVHDLRNLLGVIVSAKHLLERRPKRPRREALLQAIEDAAVRGGRLTTALLSEESSVTAPPPVEIGRRVADLAPMMNALAGPALIVDVQLASKNAHVRVDPADFDAAMLELVANARHAGATKTVVRVRASLLQHWILICDNGSGMSAAMLARARAGRDAGRARGTGLALIHQFASSCHGSLRIRSRPGAGTTVALILPTLLEAQVDRPIAASWIVSKQGRKHDGIRRAVAA